MKCATCQKEIEAKPLFEKGMFFCSQDCKEKAKNKKMVCEGNVCKIE